MTVERQRPRIVIAGFGNILLGDDGFGVEVVQRLQKLSLPFHVETFETGIAGMELVLKLMEGFDEMIVVDTVRCGKTPGTLVLFPPSVADLQLPTEERIDPHLAEPTSSMRMAMKLHILPKKIMVIGCEPESCVLGLGLSRPVRGAVDQAVEKICSLITDTAGAVGTNA